MRKLFLFLCAALMSAASMWAQTETLLTTITATAQEQASYSTANVATVSFSHTAGGSSAYIALWGWWGYGWSATVNAAEGYTITKCVFYDDQNRTATDSEAPFVVETTEEDKTPKVNGTPILEWTSKGIKKIEVYGYENPTTVNVTGITLSQTEAAMTVGGETLTLTATVNPNNATDQSVSWSTSDGNVATVENGVVTAVAAGNATITVTTTDGSFTATCAVTVTAPEPQPATTVVTITDSDFPSEGQSFTKDGVTVSALAIDRGYGDISGPGSFSTTLGNFTKIEVNANYVGIAGEGWSGDEYKTWTGNAASVSFDGVIYGIGEIVFTIEPASTPEPQPEPEPEPATTYNVTFTDINSNVKVVENITLPHTFSCDYTNGNGELDQIIQEFYNEPGGHCATNGWPWGGNDNEVVVGHDGNNHFVTINAPFIGTSFMSGYYDGINDGNFYYTFHITIAASTPEPTTHTLQLVADPEKGSVAVTNLLGSDIIDNGNGNYTVPENAEVTILATPLEGYEFTGWKVGNIDEMVGCYYCGTAVNTEDNPYTFTMTADVAYLAEFEAAAPATMFNLAYEDKWLKVNPTDGEGQYFVFVEDKEYYDNRYIQYDQTTMQNYLDYVVGVVVGMSAQSNFVFSGEKDIDPDPIYHTWYDNDHLLINHDYVAFVFKIANDARTSDVEYLILTYEGEPEAGAVEHVALNVKQAKKVVVDGQLYIVRDGKLFNVTGAQVK